MQTGIADYVWSLKEIKLPIELAVCQPRSARHCMSRRMRLPAGQVPDISLPNVSPLERKFRQEHPTMTDADIELLIDDALSKGLRQQPGRSLDGPLLPAPVDCTSSPVGRPVSPNCY